MNDASHKRAIYADLKAMPSHLVAGIAFLDPPSKQPT